METGPRRLTMKRPSRIFPALALALGAVVAALAASAFGQTNAEAREALLARAKSFELDTPYVPPPGDPLEHHAAGFAKIMCSAVFITGLDPDFAAENVGYFTAPYAERAKLGKPVIDRAKRTVQISVPNRATRIAVYLGDQGCVTLPIGRTSVLFRPERVPSRLPDAAKQPWPTGDLPPKDPLPPSLDMAKVQQAVDAAFDPPSGLTAAFLVTWKGRIIGEAHGDGITSRTPLESWSMGKSVAAALV